MNKKYDKESIKRESMNFSIIDSNKKITRNELDIIKDIDEAILYYNRDPNNHYLLRVKKAVRRAWF